LGLTSQILLYPKYLIDVTVSGVLTGGIFYGNLYYRQRDKEEVAYYSIRNALSAFTREEINTNPGGNFHTFIVTDSVRSKKN
jgi:hypothetical protein